MTVYRIEARGEARELYEIEADSEEQARAKFSRGECSDPFLTEVDGSEIVAITVEEATL